MVLRILRYAAVGLNPKFASRSLCKTLLWDKWNDSFRCEYADAIPLAFVCGMRISTTVPGLSLNIFLDRARLLLHLICEGHTETVAASDRRIEHGRRSMFR